MAYGETPEQSAKKKLQALIDRKLQDAKKKRNERAALINETYRLAAPWRRLVSNSSTSATMEPSLTEEDIADICDATLAETMADFASDMIAQFTPDSEPWTRFEAKGSVPPQLKKDVDQMSALVEERVFEALQDSSYYDAAPQCFQELSNGTMAIRCRRPERGGDPFEFEPIEPADLLLCHSPARGVADARFTEATIPYSDFKSLYGRYAKLPANKRPPKDEEDCTVVDGFYRCWENMRGDKAWRRCVLLNGDVVFEKFVSDDHDVDVIVGRWEVNGKSPWGVGPAFRAHPAQRALNELTAILMVAASKHADTPGFYVDDGVVNLEQGFEAGDMIPTSENFDVKWWEPKGQLDITFFTESDLRTMIRRALFQDKPEQKGKTPPTAEQWQSLEVRSRQRWEIPRGKIVREWVLPIVLWTKRSLEMMNQLGPYQVDNRAFTIVPNSPFAKARQQEEIVRANDLLKAFATYSPNSFPVAVDIPATMNGMKVALNDKLVVIRSKEDMQKLMQLMQQAQQPQAAPPNGQ